MPFPTATDPMGGKLSVEIGSTLIPSDFLGPLTANVSQVERDVTFPVARVSFEDKSERNATDDLSVVIHIYPQVNPLGQIIYGTIGS